MYFGEKRLGHPEVRSQALIDSLVVVPLTEELAIFQGSETALRQKQVYDRYQCRSQALQLTPPDELGVECAAFACRVAGMLFTRAFGCDCDPTGSISGTS